MWRYFKDGVLKACDEVCEKKIVKRSKGDTWWWNEEMKEALSWKKDVDKAMCLNSTGENKRRYKGIENRAKK